MVYFFLHLTSLYFTFFPFTDIFSTNMVIIFQRTKTERGHLGNDLSVRPSVCLSFCLSVRPSVYLSVCPSVRLSVYLSVCLSVRPSVRLSVCPSVCLSVRPSVCLSVCLSIFRCRNQPKYSLSLICSMTVKISNIRQN